MQTYYSLECFICANVSLSLYMNVRNIAVKPMCSFFFLKSLPFVNLLWNNDNEL